MKKLILLFFIVFGAVYAANAQASLKLGWTYAFGSDEGGLNIGGKYDINRQWDVVAGLSFYFPGKNYDLWMIDFDGHYKFPMGGGLVLYPLFGLNFTTYDSDYYENDAHTEIGINAGGGAQFDIAGPFGAFLELKYILGNYDQGVLGLGVTYRL